MAFVGGVVLAALALPAAAQTSTLTITDTTGDPNLIQVAPGAPFILNVTLNATHGFNGISYYLKVLESAGSGVFAITGRSNTLNGDPEEPRPTPLEDAQAPNSQVIDPTGGNNVLNPRNDSDLGYSNSPASSDEIAGSYLLARLTLVAGNVPGTYTLRTVSAREDNGSTFGAKFTTAANVQEEYIDSNIYTVVVTPEPGTAGLAAASLALLGLRRRRARGA